MRYREREIQREREKERERERETEKDYIRNSKQIFRNIVHISYMNMMFYNIIANTDFNDVLLRNWIYSYWTQTCIAGGVRLTITISTICSSCTYCTCIYI